MFAIDHCTGKNSPHTLRHTPVSWHLRTGVAASDVSDHCGVSEAIIKKYYMSAPTSRCLKPPRFGKSHLSGGNVMTALAVLAGLIGVGPFFFARSMGVLREHIYFESRNWTLAEHKTGVDVWL